MRRAKIRPGRTGFSSTGAKASADRQFFVPLLAELWASHSLAVNSFSKLLIYWE
jgi:hypothetical protein